MKNLLLFLFILMTSCSPKTTIISTEKPEVEKHDFSKVKTVYYFYENENWVIGEPDEIPSPEANLDFLKAMYSTIVYPAMARENGVQGSVILSVLIDETGQVLESEIKEDLRHGCGEAALNAFQYAAKRERLPPITKNGIPQKIKVDYPVNFKLE